MHALWHWTLYVLTATSADPQLLEQERARTAGAVNVAYASLATEPAPAPKQEPARAISRDLTALGGPARARPAQVGNAHRGDCGARRATH
jgi:hypothetical protein